MFFCIDKRTKNDPQTGGLTTLYIPRGDIQSSYKIPRIQSYLILHQYKKAHTP